MFQVFLAPGHPGEELLTPQTVDDTMAQVMTPEEAAAVGFSGLPEAPEGVQQRFIIVGQSDRRRIMQALEHSPQVAKFAVHEISL